MPHDILGIGLTGTTLTDLEREIIREHAPYAVVLFGRNIGDVQQTRELIREVKSIAPRPPLFTIDEEGGRVDRIRHLLPGLPSAQAFAEGEQAEELAHWFGRIVGMALRYLDIEIDLAPVVDIRADQSPKGLERRTFGDNADTVVALAGAFMRGMHAMGVASCLKHFPGIGRGSADPHYGATVMNMTRDELRARDLVPFVKLGNEAGAVMIGHGTYPQIDEPDLPATLSHCITTDVLRGDAGFSGLAMTDDMEMHAVSDLGSYEVISERALKAGNDVILFCSHIERYPAVQEFLERRRREEPSIRARFDDAVQRAENYRQHCLRIKAAGAPPLSSFEQLVEENIRFCDEFQKTRPEGEVYVPAIDRRKSSRTPGTGRSGREEGT